MKEKRFTTEHIVSVLNRTARIGVLEHTFYRLRGCNRSGHNGYDPYFSSNYHALQVSTVFQ